ncbi:MAG: histidinol dehydrogenase [Acidimicrobiales bacterium]
MALERLDVRGLGDRLEDVLPRPEMAHEDLATTVAAIISQVRRDGDDALRALTVRFDDVEIDDIAVPGEELQAALGRIPGELRSALEAAHRRIVAYHELDEATETEMISEGVRITHLVRPVTRAGCYVPGGLARYPSTVLMCAAPARVAGVAEVVLCVPPGPGGHVDDATLAAAAIGGVDALYRVGGAQAVAAMAYGTESIRRVDVIVGPGNKYVAEAMRQVSGVVGIPAAYAGPSEVLVVAGPETPAELAAIDLAVQAEHGPDGLSWLVSWSEEKLDEIDKELGAIVADSPRRRALEATLASGGYACLVEGPEQAIAVANVVAPEHLELMVDGARELLALVRSAGAVFLGRWSPAALGDYVAGPNHVLPTNRSARFASALSARDFRRHIHAVEADRAAIAALGPHVIALATTEGLDAHAQSIELRR